ncbi:MAG: phosphatidylglycerophosphatase A [Acidobacteria bacterium]|nr:phosphatidylglycerophosphatase A [Acidobacteriota bacterium]
MTNPAPFADKRGKSFNSQGATDWLAVIIATGGGAGFVPIAPGTWGSLVGLLIAYGLIVTFKSNVALLQNLLIIVSVVLGWVGIWAGTRAETVFGKKDSGQIVIDEVCGQVITFVFIAPFLAALGNQWRWWMIPGFFLFRAFDIFKPFPINGLQSLTGGLGVMMDDIIAGIYAAVLLSLAMQIAS